MSAPIQIGLGDFAYSRAAADGPAVICENYYYEPMKTSVSGGVLIPMPGLVRIANGVGPLRGLHRLSGCLGGDVVTVQGTSIIRTTQALVSSVSGICSGSGLVSIAGNAAGVMIANGVTLQYLTGSGLTTLTIPFSAPTSVGFASGFWFCTDAGTQRRYLALEITPTVWIEYNAATESPDLLLASFRVGSRIVDFGERSIEFRYATGDVDAPFAPDQGRSYERGTASKDTIVVLDNSFFWVGDDLIVYRGGEVPGPISEPFISEELSKVAIASIYATSFTWQGHVFYCLTIGDRGTYCFDLTTGRWIKRVTYGLNAWATGMSCIGWDGKPIMGNRLTGTLYTLSGDVFTDDGIPLVGRISGWVPIVGQRNVASVLRLMIGTGNIDQSDGDEPLVSMRISRDGLRSWGSSLERSLGRAGEYEKRVIWRRLGQFKPPGAGFEFMISDSVPRSITGAYLGGDF
jgi:hypothetical protein